MRCSKHFLTLAIALSSAAYAPCAAAQSWDDVDNILQQIKPPKFADGDFVITDYGAKGDGKTDCRPAFADAIKACVAAGGGRVVTPPGEWLVNGPIHLQSGVNLHLEAGATVRFSHDAAHYLPLVFTRFEGTELMNYSPLIYAIDQQNIAVTGEGALDGQAAKNRWWHWKGKWGGEVDHGWRPGDPDQISALKKLTAAADAGAPPAERVFGEGSRLRPNFIQFYRCKNALIEDVTVVNSPMWVLHPVLCENVTVRSVNINSHGPNNDGCNPESCRNVLIENCTFDTGDDCIAIKSGRNADGRRLNTPSENIVIRNCSMKDGHGGVTMGSEMSGGVRNVFVEDCSMSSPNLERAIRIKSNSRRGGYVENVFVRDVDVPEVSDAVIHIDLRYDDEVGEHFPTVRNLYIDRLTAGQSKQAFYLLGTAEQPIENVVVSNSSFANASEPSFVESVDAITLKNVSMHD